MKQSDFLAENSTCQFCDRVAFMATTKSWLGKPRESVVADTPDDWFEYLARTKTLGLRILRRSQNDPHNSDRMSAGFVGGGGDWMLAARRANALDYWMARWEVWNQNAPNRRIWRVTYALVATAPVSQSDEADRDKAFAALEAALARIHEFSSGHNCGGFTECFGRARESLSQVRADNGYHKDLYPPGELSASSQALLDAAQSAWVFGGMGSWNDMGFDGEDGKEYEAASEQLFSALVAAICVAANESDRR